MSTDSFFTLTFKPGNGLHLRVCALLLNTAQQNQVQCFVGRSSCSTNQMKASLTGYMLLGIKGGQEARLRVVGHPAAITKFVSDLTSLDFTVQPETTRPKST